MSVIRELPEMDWLLNERELPELRGLFEKSGLLGKLLEIETLKLGEL